MATTGGIARRVLRRAGQSLQQRGRPHSTLTAQSISQGQNRVVDASLTLVRERARLRMLRSSSSSSVVLLVQASLAYGLLWNLWWFLLYMLASRRESKFEQSVVQWRRHVCLEYLWATIRLFSRVPRSLLLASEKQYGKDLEDVRVMTDAGDLPVQEMRDCGVGDERLMNTISEAVKIVMNEVDILHLDAHPDIYHAFEGNIYSHASGFARIMEGGYARRLLQVGIRSINKEGREQGKKFGVEQYEMRNYSEDRKFLENLKLGEGVKGVYVSIDVDCLDPAFAPGVSHIEPGGLSFRDVMNIVQNLQGDIVGGDVVEFNPQRDTVDGMTAMVAAKLVRELAAKMSR
ncbi:hypothetical protein AXG93_1502s1120 [Marchantia polymorpha subsp. ruderalis]|uniref:Arginase n=1 Tax=Marchantia polymorpha subsp. ruderalis TaxID=1480154 RepID=A0A176WF91_MARPO|nr:hypothetical protein AXG93_1502s1120 [Marchantia polymorpha subsp. ruderalis]